MTARPIFRWLLISVYVAIGLVHLLRTDAMLPIMPSWVPWPREVIRVTGVCELLGAAGLALAPLRRISGVMLALYAVCVFPANIHHALDHVRVGGLPSSWWYHGPRLLFQPVFVWWALWAGGVTEWPFARRARDRSTGTDPSPPGGPPPDGPRRRAVSPKS